MRIIFCNTTYLRYYDGRIAGELKPISGGRWVKENQDAHEKWNFLNVDGYCYGYVQGNEQMHIERIDKKFAKQESGDDVTVVWCAKHPEKGETVIVGWYEHATVFRYLEYSKITPATGLDRAFWFCTEAENAYLLPEEERTMVIGRASKDGTGNGFGQMNYWFADSDYAKENIIPKVREYIETHKESRINILTKEFDPPTNMTPVTKEELDKVGDLDNLTDFEYLPIGYRLFEYQKQDADGAYLIGKALCNLHQYTKAINWFEKVLELDPEDWDTMGLLIYVYSQCEMHEKAVDLAKRLLDSPTAVEKSVRDEVYCMLADGYFFQGNVAEAVMWQERILQESCNKELIEYTKNLKKQWEEALC